MATAISQDKIRDIIREELAAAPPTNTDTIATTSTSENSLEEKDFPHQLAKVKQEMERFCNERVSALACAIKQDLGRIAKPN